MELITTLYCEACSVECNFSYLFCNYDYVIVFNCLVINVIHVFQKNIKFLAKVNHLESI